MSSTNASALDKAIAHAVAQLLATATRPGAPASAWQSARDAAQLLTLEGLDHALAACAAHAGSPPPPDVAALIDRLARLAQAARDAGDLAPLRVAGAELNALAEELSGYEWAAPQTVDLEARVTVPALDVTDVLDDVALVGDESRGVAQRSRLPIPVAAAVRAAIDWLTHPGAASVVRLFGEPSLLELRLDRIRTDRLYPAHRVIAAAGGNLGAAIDGLGWLVRVPSFAERPTYLMLVQGGVRIAVPWHAVLKLRIVSASAVASGKGSMDYPMIPPVAPPTAEASEYPVVLLGHGLKRAYWVADRLIWRMTAEPCENEWGSPAAGLRDPVRTEDGEVFWVADPARLLADVELPQIALDPAMVAREPASRPRVPASEVPAPASSPRAPADQEATRVQPERTRELRLAPRSAPEPAAQVPPSPPAPALAPVEVAPSEPAAPATASAQPAPAVAPAPATTPVDALAAEPPAPVAPPAARALVADDSLTMRMLLARLLEHQGFTVETVANATELAHQLNRAAWNVLFTDLELPDGSGPEWLRQICRVAASRPHPVHVVALVRDGGDLDVARSAGVRDTLLKPFARESLAALIARHGWRKA